MRWIIEKYLGKGNQFELIGEVDARHQPAAIIAAFDKFNIRENAEQKKIRARPAAPRDLSPQERIA
jgi:hypothetical protein